MAKDKAAVKARIGAKRAAKAKSRVWKWKEKVRLYRELDRMDHRYKRPLHGVFITKFLAFIILISLLVIAGIVIYYI